MDIRHKRTDFIEITMSTEEFKRKLGIADSLSPFFVSLVRGVEITCSGTLPEEPEPAEPAPKKHLWEGMWKLS